MGREVKRVPLNFDWPIRKIWYGYLMQTCLEDCESCKHYAKLKNLSFTNYGCPRFEVDPPVGGGYQLWEDTSEGSPLTPVFETIEELAAYCADVNNGVTLYGSFTLDYENWCKCLSEMERSNQVISKRRNHESNTSIV